MSITDTHIGTISRSYIVSGMAKDLKRIQLEDRISEKAMFNDVATKYFNLKKVVSRFDERGLEAIPIADHKKNKVTSKLIALQEWEGCVLDIQGESFTASLYDLTNKRGLSDEEAEFEIGDIAQPDLSLFAVGSVFRWIIGYRIKPSGRARESQIIFRRMPKWTAERDARAGRQAERLMKTIIWK